MSAGTDPNDARRVPSGQPAEVASNSQELGSSGIGSNHSTNPGSPIVLRATDNPGVYRLSLSDEATKKLGSAILDFLSRHKGESGKFYAIELSRLQTLKERKYSLPVDGEGELVTVAKLTAAFIKDAKGTQIYIRGAKDDAGSDINLKIDLGSKPSKILPQPGASQKQVPVSSDKADTRPSGSEASAVNSVNSASSPATRSGATDEDIESWLGKADININRDQFSSDQVTGLDDSSAESQRQAHEKPDNSPQAVAARAKALQEKLAAKELTGDSKSAAANTLRKIMRPDQK